MKCFDPKRCTAALTVGGLLAFGVLAFSVLSEPGIASTQQADNARQGLPGRRISGGSRSPNTACLATPSQPVVALMPKSNLVFTVSEHPTFWFSLPAVSLDRTLEFGLYDSSGERLYTRTFSPPENAKVTSLSLPDTFAPLAVDKDYRWYLSVVCNQESRAEDLVVTGWIRRVQPSSSLGERLAVATDKERLAIYKESALWYDAITTLAKLRFSDPAANTLEQQWANLLETLELPQVIAAPFGSELIPTTQMAQNEPPLLGPYSTQ